MLLRFTLSLAIFFYSSALCWAATLFQEMFDDANFASRGWYDAPGGQVDTNNHIQGSTASFLCNFNVGSAGCSGGAPARHKFTPTNSVYVSFWLKHSSNWTNTIKFQHFIYILTTEDGDYAGLASDHLDAYINENQLAGLELELELQDALNIDLNNIGVNLVGMTENRASHGCNGYLDTTHDAANCYLLGNTRVNYRMWKSSQKFTDTSGPYYKGDFHFIEAYFQLNTISNGIGIADGVMQMWIDGVQTINKTGVAFRTGTHPNMQFNQLIIGPSGNPAIANEQFWMDDLTVATDRPATGPPSPPQNLQVQ